MIGVIQIGLITLVVMAAWSDLRTRHIPNWITAPGAAFGLILQTYYFGIQGTLASLEGAAIGLAFFIAFYIAGGMGAGDVKLFGAVGAFVGPESMLIVFVFTGLLGGVASIALILFLRAVGRWTDRDRKYLPYGPVIAGGTLAFLMILR